METKFTKWSNKSLAFALMAAGVVWITACPSMGGKGGASCQPGYCAGNVQRVLTLDSTTPGYPASNPCVYQPEHLRCSNCQLNSLSVTGAGGSQVPAGADLRHDSTIDNNRSVTVGPPWSAVTNALNCSSGPGCADGTYVVRLENPNGYDCRDFGTATLRLTLN